MSAPTPRPKTVFLVNCGILFFIYALAVVIFTREPFLIFNLLPSYLIALIIPAIFAFKYKRSIAETFGYTLLMFLLVGLVGFSACMGAINAAHF